MKLIVTIGPSSLNEQTLKTLVECGVDDFRINLSHSSLELLEHYYSFFRRCGITPSLDTQGAQIRIKSISSNDLTLGDKVILPWDDCLGVNSASKYHQSHVLLAVNHPLFVKQLVKGDLLRLDFAGAVLRIDELDADERCARMTVVTPGHCCLNRAIDVIGKSLDLPPLTPFDYEAIEYGLEHGMKNLYFSFASCPNDITSIRKNLSSSARIISKIENKKGILSLDGIATASDEILIDRGDLSREVSISMLPILTESVIKKCEYLNTPVNVATNILDSMMTQPLPSRAEISDIWNLVSMGAKGLVLAAEVAIGSYPVECAQIVKYMFKQHELHSDGFSCISQSEFLKDRMSEPLKSWL